MSYSTKLLWFWVGPGAVLAVYATVNLCRVFLPFIPGVGDFLFFGILAPIVFAIVHYTWVRKRRDERKYWKPWALAGAFLYVALGVFTFHTITQLWASV